MLLLFCIVLFSAGGSGSGSAFGEVTGGESGGAVVLLGNVSLVQGTQNGNVADAGTQEESLLSDDTSESVFMEPVQKASQAEEIPIVSVSDPEGLQAPALSKVHTETKVPPRRTREPIKKKNKAPLVNNSQKVEKQKTEDTAPAYQKSGSEQDLQSTQHASHGKGGMQVPGEGNGEVPGGDSGQGNGSGGGKAGSDSAGIGYAVNVDSKPKILKRSKVTYPELARKRSITGQVVLRFHLDEKGRMSQLHIVRSEPPGVFDDAALTAVRQWTFSPATKDGKPVPYWVELPMPFVLK